MALRIAVLISGTGSNLAAILQAIEAGRCDAEVCAVISDKASAPGLELARARGIPTQLVRLKDHGDRAAWDLALADAIGRYDAQFVVLAGFMKLVGRAMTSRYHERLINVHPSLLPAFPGTEGPAQAIAAGVRVSGCTVHLVDEGIDTGTILAQAVVPVAASDNAERLHKRIQQLEHRLLPAVIDAIAKGHLLGDNAHTATAAGDQDSLVSPAWVLPSA